MLRSRRSLSRAVPGLAARAAVLPGPVLPGRVLPAILLAGALSLTACGNSSADGPSGDPRAGVPTTVSAAPPTTAPPASAGSTFPLTGRPAPDQAAATRTTVAVAVDGGTGASAPVGTERADLAYVTFPAAGRQRALALFQSSDTDRIGPVGDTRPLDSKLLFSAGSVLEHSGGTSGFVKQVGAADVPQWSSLVHPDTFARDSSTGQVFGSTTAARAAPGAAPAVGGLLTFADPATAPAAGAAPAAVVVGIPGQPEIRLTYDAASSTWRGTAGTFPLAATNVVLQQVPYDPLVLPKTGGRTEGSPNVDGDGKAALLSGTKVDLAATWNRPGRATSIKYVGADGVPTRFVPGTTWVLLLPTGSTVGTA